MSAASGNSSSGGIGLAGATFIVFLVLKLTHVIAWSWFYVTLPLWGGVAFFLGLAGIFMSIGLTVSAIESRRNRKRAALKRAEYQQRLKGGQ